MVAGLTQLPRTAVVMIITLINTSPPFSTVGDRMSYVSRYLESIERQADGWPTNVSDETKKWAVAKIRAKFVQLKQLLGRDHMDLETACSALFDRFQVTDIPDDISGASLYDFQYAVADRALRVVANQAWVLIHP